MSDNGKSTDDAENDSVGSGSLEESHIESSDVKECGVAGTDEKPRENGEDCHPSSGSSQDDSEGDCQEEAPTKPKLPVKPSLKSSNSSHQLSKTNSQYRVHFPDQEVTKIVETEVIVVPSCSQRMFYQMFCCCKRPYKP